MAGLLVSVRSIEEAAAALAGGADIIDVKEPAEGPLGRADDTVIADIVTFVAGRRPVSAACGELLEERPPVSTAGLSFVKWGLAGCRDVPSWPRRLAKLQASCPGQVVFVAYADWECAQAPSVEEVVDLACRQPGNTLLIDTHCKDAAKLDTRRPTLLDWLTERDVFDLCSRCRNNGVRIALAGSLTAREITLLRDARPDWFAIRGAVCTHGVRNGTVDEEKVRELAHLLAE